jgi:ATP-binding protein involved in chromosome partitioning
MSGLSGGENSRFEGALGGEPGRAALLDAARIELDRIVDPESGRGLVAAGRISGLTLRPDGRIGFVVEAASRDAVWEAVRLAAEKAAAGVSGVMGATAVLTAHVDAPERAPAAVHGGLRGASVGPASVRVQKGVKMNPGAAAALAPRPAPAGGIPGVGAIVAVASGKGGVGKSTVAVNLACALARLGRRVGLLDADVYGPSVPRLLGLSAAKPEVGADKKLAPLEAWGLKAMSIGFLVDEDAPMIWRGPIVMSALTQMMNDVNWGTLDILIVDMPPGTGDAQLTMAQRVSLAGAVIVSTPQEIALTDVRRGVEMFRKTHVPILGVVQNMAYFEEASGRRVHIFGEDGARRTAAAYGAPFLGDIALIPAIRELSDAGSPPAALDPAGPAAAPFYAIALGVLSALEDGAGAKPAPRIRFVD